jgi:hypothetical protein
MKKTLLLLVCSAAAFGELHEFRITVGLTDTFPKDWRGKVTAAGGQVVSLRGWRHSQRDIASGDGSFWFKTKIGALEDQLRTNFPYGQTDWGDPNIRRLTPQGVIVRIQGSPATRVKFDAGIWAFEFTNGDVTYARPAMALEGNARIERLPIEEKLSEAGPADDQPSIALGPKGERWAVWLSYKDSGDTVVASDGKYATNITDKGDHQGPVVAVTPNGWVHTAWAAREGSEFHIYTSAHALGRWTSARRVSQPGSSNFSPSLVTDDAGRMALVWQSLHAGQSLIRMKYFDGKKWSEEETVNSGKGNAWAPAASFGGGKLWIAWDSYETGSYQVYARQHGESKVHRVTAGDLFCVRPAIAVTASGVPVVIWEESDALWGKDYAFLIDRRGTSLYKNRRLRLAWLASDGWKEHPAPIADALPPSQRRFLQQPQLAFDPSGRLHLAFRCRTSASTARIDHWASGGRWETFLTSLDGDRWTRAIPMPASDGRNSMRASIAASSNGIHVAWATDNRIWPQVKYGDVDVYAARVAATSSPSLFRNGTPLTAPPAAVDNPHPGENQDIARIRDYRVSMNGKTYRILRGDLHRHTELSQDGSGDGSLEDLYRYALDAAQMDYAHVADHQMGVDEEYNWWITQKSNDLYLMPGRFVPLFGYERSVPFPNGHRNIIWAERGKQVLRISPREQQGAIDTGPVLYPYLKGTGGIATSHTSATQQGTDWRDNDPAVEPFVEIYQGFESSYEHEGAPRAWKEGEKAVHQGLRKQGYVWEAWAKGYKLGVQSSSDHVSTHASFACILVEEFSRQGLLDAMRKRHTYAATDAIILDFRLNGKGLMGDILRTASIPKLEVRAHGTARIRQIDVIKNNTYIHKVNPERNDMVFEYADTAITEGESYYYVRVQQTDGQLAWSSPIWVRYAKP